MYFVIIMFLSVVVVEGELATINCPTQHRLYPNGDPVRSVRMMNSAFNNDVPTATMPVHLE